MGSLQPIMTLQGGLAKIKLGLPHTLMWISDLILLKGIGYDVELSTDLETQKRLLTPSFGKEKGLDYWGLGPDVGLDLTCSITLGNVVPHIALSTTD